ILNRLRDEMLDMGYTMDEIHDRFGGNLDLFTLRDVLHFIATRRLKHRYNPATDELILDGEVQACRSVESVDAEVTE
ncbi:unnamed protein product, partial [marine sediment metagenome]